MQLSKGRCTRITLPEPVNVPAWIAYPQQHTLPLEGALIFSFFFPTRLCPVHRRQAGMRLGIGRHLADNAVNHAPGPRRVAGLEQQRGLPEAVAC